MREAGLEVARDAAGNLFGRRGAARVWCGSHLDSVPTAGRFDGVLGVVAAIEAAERLPAAELAVVAFRAEETGPMGSKQLSELPEAFLELHIEQGPVLERLGAPLGIVTAIAGQARAEKVFEGRADHAGTTPMDGPRPPAPPPTVGALEVEPNAVNVVPAKVTVAIDARAPTREQLDELVAAIGFEPTMRNEPATMSGAPLEALRAALPGAPELVSGAGHDAMVLAAAGVPTAMLFVRSLNGGISHHPDELSSPEDVAAAVDALTDALARLTTRA
jgi:acetylornithine deacetylase/succinyl-diaminopimelate desuccinylase-like protein